MEEIFAYLSALENWAKVTAVIAIVLFTIAIVFGKPKVTNTKEIIPPNTIASENNEDDTSKKSMQWEVHEYHEVDDNGHDFDFKVYILGNEFNWLYRSCNTITFNDQEFDLTELTEYIKSVGVQHTLKDAKDIITVGLASQEIMKNAPDEEIAIEFENMRAFRRARILKFLTKKNTKTNANFHKLTLGKYSHNETTSPNKNKTSMQRRIIIIAVFDRDENENLGDLLPQILPRVENFPINLSDYNLFQLGDIDFSNLYDLEYANLMQEFNKYCYNNLKDENDK